MAPTNIRFLRGYAAAGRHVELHEPGITGAYSAGVLTLTGSATPAQYTAALNSITFSNTINGSVATRNLSVQAFDAALSSNALVVTIDVVAPAEVTGIWAGSSNWSGTFDGYLVTRGVGNSSFPSAGYALRTGGAQTTALPWSNINKITVQFDESLASLNQNSLVLAGGTGAGILATPTVTSFTSLGDNTYQWALSAPLSNDHYLISFMSNGANGVNDTRGAPLSGDWSTASSVFPSGNGLSGGDFNFYFNVLPGDTNQNGTVNASDANLIKTVLNFRTSSSGYNPSYDIDGNGTINALDVNLAKSALNARLTISNTPQVKSVNQIATALMNDGETDAQVVTALADTADTVDQIAGALDDIFADNDVRIASVLSAAGYSTSQIARGLKDVIGDSGTTVTNILIGLNATITNVASALQSTFSDSDSEVASVLYGQGNSLPKSPPQCRIRSTTATPRWPRLPVDCTLRLIKLQVCYGACLPIPIKP